MMDGFPPHSSPLTLLWAAKTAANYIPSIRPISAMY